MTLKIKIQNDLLEAVKQKEEIISLVLRQVSAAILNKEKEKRYKFTRQNFPKENLGGLSKGETSLKVAEGEPRQWREEELEKESQLADEEVIDVIASEAKKRKEAILEFGKGKREDLVEKEKAELEILKKYLPEQLSEEEIKKLAEEIIKKIGATGQKNMGRVMAELTPKIKGRADGSLASKVVKELLV